MELGAHAVRHPFEAVHVVLQPIVGLKKDMTVESRSSRVGCGLMFLEHTLVRLAPYSSLAIVPHITHLRSYPSLQEHLIRNPTLIAMSWHCVIVFEATSEWANTIVLNPSRAFSSLTWSCSSRLFLLRRSACSRTRQIQLFPIRGGS